ncbi:MAG: hypothetical protein CMB80_33350 [Flammeovirgaceae bacterium]|nr:hypothetical protein [Flammeovirgaceae bacterium]|tara:strand:+ start:266 stop:652 length:387 start_codon:yes stop_codon:yes gene_type:complete
MELSRLASRDNYRKVEEEWQYEFIYHVLSTIGIPEEILEGCFPEEGIDSFTVHHKIELRHYMKKFDVTIVDDRDGGIKIFVEQDIIAEWKKCKFVLKEDPKTVDPSQRLYMEIKADVWTIFDEGNADE